MMDLVTLFQPPENGDGILDSGLVHHDSLESTLKRLVLFHVFPVLVEGRCSNAVEFTPREHWLQDIAGIHGPLGSPGTNHRVQLIDK